MEELSAETSRRLGGGATKMFGSLVTIPEMIGSISFLIIICTVILFEVVSEKLTERSQFTKWEQMVAAIKNELMVVGAMAFILKCLLFSINNIDPDWLHAIEFADLVVPITAFFFVIQGMCFIVLANAEERRILHIYENMHEDVPPPSFYSEKTTLEFKCAKYMFCQEYSLTPASFAYGEYLARVCHKHIVGVVRIEITNWLTVLAAIFLNWARLALGIFNSKDACYKKDYACKDLNDIKLFTVMGAVICGLVLALVIATATYHHRLLYSQGLYKKGDASSKARWDKARKVAALQAFLSQCREGDPPKERRQSKIEELRKVREQLKTSSSISLRDEESGRAHLVTRVGDQGLAACKSANPLSRLAALLPEDEEERGKYSPFMKQMFLFGRPELYFSMIDHVLMLISFYMSLWVVNFAYSTDDFHSYSEMAGWKVLSLVPGLLAAVMFAYVVRSSYLLKAVTYLDESILIEMLEDQKELLNQRDIVKDAIFSAILDEDSVYAGKDPKIKTEYIRTLQKGDGGDLLTAYFKKHLDEDDNAKLSKAELKAGFEEKLGIFLSKKLWHIFFACIDKDCSGFVELFELQDFLFDAEI